MQARSRVRRAVFAVCGGVFAHAHYRFRKRALLVPSRCDLIPANLAVADVHVTVALVDDIVKL